MAKVLATFDKKKNATYIVLCLIHSLPESFIVSIIVDTLFKPFFHITFKLL